MVVVGGGSQSRPWQQIYADAMNVKVVKTNVGQEAGSLGAAAVAAVGAGLWEDFTRIDQLHEVEEVYEPIQRHAKKYEKLLPIFRRAARCHAQIGDMLAELEL
jgi:xylulokinase